MPESVGAVGIAAPVRGVDPRRLATCDPPICVEAPTEHVRCALCGADADRVVCDRDRYGLPIRVVQCECGLQYQNPRLSADQYARFYRDTYRALIARWDDTYSLASMEADQWMYAANLSNVVAPWMTDGMRILDVGGSTGIVGRLFRARWGGSVTVIDPSPDELARAIDCTTICAAAEEATFPPADVALACRTLDHLLDPVGVLRRIRARVLVVDAADVMRWPAHGRYKIDHPYAFTAATLTRVVEAAGWHVERMWSRRQGWYVGLIASPQE